MFGGFRKKDKSKVKSTANTNNESSSNGTYGNASLKGTDSNDIEDYTILAAPQLKDVPLVEQPTLFVKHLRLCQQVFNFDLMENLKEKEAKRILLLGLVDYINNPNTRIQETMFMDIIEMVSANIFRTLAPRLDMAGDADDDEPMLEIGWAHIQVVYEFLLRFVVNTGVEPKVAKKYISQPFILQLLNLFDSEDPRERDYLKTILHRIYGKFMALRAFIRKAISNVFFCGIYLNDKHNGIAELLEILGSIINGFALPLKPEHQHFLVQGLIPLHKVPSIVMFHQQLEYCIMQFVEKDNKMAEPVVLGLLKYWPHANSPKQLQFLHELEEVFESIQIPEFRVVTTPLFTRIAECLGSQHFQVAERTLLLWNSEFLFSLITQNRAKILPLVYGILSFNAESHWNSTVQSLSQNVLRSFQEMDKSLYDEVVKMHNIRIQEMAKVRADRDLIWDSLQARTIQ